MQGDITAFNSYEGAPNAYVEMDFKGVNNLGTISTWLISPLLDLSTGVNGTFYTRTISAHEYADRMYVRYSTSSTIDVGNGADTVGNFTHELIAINPNLIRDGYPGSWTRYTIDIPAQGSGVTGYVAFHYYVTNAGLNGDNSIYIGIDSVYITKKCDIYLPTTTTTGVTSSISTTEISSTTGTASSTEQTTLSTTVEATTTTTGGFSTTTEAAISTTTQESSTTTIGITSTVTSNSATSSTSTGSTSTTGSTISTGATISSTSGSTTPTTTDGTSTSTGITSSTSTTGTTSTTGGSTTSTDLSTAKNISINGFESNVLIMFPAIPNATAFVDIATSDILEYVDPTASTPPGASLLYSTTFFITIQKDKGLVELFSENPIYVLIEHSNGFTAEDDLWIYDTIAKQWLKVTSTCENGIETIYEEGSMLVPICHLTQFALFHQPKIEPAPVTQMNSSTKLSTGAIVAIVAVPILIVVIVGLLVIVYREKKKNSQLAKTQKNNFELQMLT